MQTKLKTLLQKADEEKFAIIAFNITDTWDLLGVVKAAEQEKAPIMVATVQPVAAYLELWMAAAIGHAAMANAKVPVILHLDHTGKVSFCCDAVDHGYPSIMIDGSLLPLEENIALVKPVVEYAHAHGVHVEGELGHIMGRNYEGVLVEGTDYLTDVGQAVEFVERTGVDSLAVGIGTGHGFYAEEPKLNIGRLAEINAATDVKLVLHGGTGTPEDQIREVIRNGINKINVGTLIYNSYLSTAKKALNAAPDKGFSLGIFRDAVDAVAEAARGWLRLSGSSGKAG